MVVEFLGLQWNHTVESPRGAVFLRLGGIIPVESPSGAVFLRLGGIIPVESHAGYRISK
jgi:hypothetical protein